MLQEHQRKIDRFLAMNREVIRQKHVEALLEGLKNGQLSEKDIIQYTSITPEQLVELMQS
ncbi:hypothetical protein [Brevibacillus sp. H7]|uniref:hypothetical protein n=1 Tax=Brevibacillus sp. H7 TaxID=3349138 RepID=UPI00382C39D5